MRSKSETIQPAKHRTLVLYYKKKASSEFQVLGFWQLPMAKPFVHCAAKALGHVLCKSLTSPVAKAAPKAAAKPCANPFPFQWA